VHVCTMEYHSAIKKMEILSFVTTRMELDVITVSGLALTWEIFKSRQWKGCDQGLGKG
jgi:hypothetical protein